MSYYSLNSLPIWCRDLQKSMECQVEKNEHFFLFKFSRGVNASDVVKTIYAVWGENTIGKKQHKSILHIQEDF